MLKGCWPRPEILSHGEASISPPARTLPLCESTWLGLSAIAEESVLDERRRYRKSADHLESFSVPKPALRRNSFQSDHRLSGKWRVSELVGARGR